MKCFVMTLKTISTWSNIEIQLPLLKVIEGNRKKLERQITFLNSLMRKSVKSVTSSIFGVNFTFRSHSDPISWTDCDAQFCVFFFFVLLLCVNYDFFLKITFVAATSQSIGSDESVNFSGTR